MHLDFSQNFCTYKLRLKVAVWHNVSGTRECMDMGGLAGPGWNCGTQHPIGRTRMEVSNCASC